MLRNMGRDYVASKPAELRGALEALASDGGERSSGLR